MIAIGANEGLKEFLGPRADSQVSKMDMYKNISMYGYTKLEELSRDITENQTLNTLYISLMGAGLSNDLLKEDISKEDLEKKILKQINK
ncbi:hypothetical protein Bp8pS_150 [Bacillus phage vB_BpuM-BpSp]|nr:hypothetical protein Bp8pS_150 [Bacillus phage vB_BpuM-BpSp]